MTPEHLQTSGLAWINAVAALIPALTVLLLAVAGMFGAVLAKLHDVSRRQDRQGQAIGTLQLNAPPPGQAPVVVAPRPAAPASADPGAARGVSDVTPAPFDPNKTILPGSADPTGEM